MINILVQNITTRQPKILKLENPDLKSAVLSCSKESWLAHILQPGSSQLAGKTMTVHSQHAGSALRYWTVQNILRVYQSLLKSNPIITKSITNGIIALIGSSISQVCKT